jgi:hypothetical protein
MAESGALSLRSLFAREGGAQRAGRQTTPLIAALTLSGIVVHLSLRLAGSSRHGLLVACVFLP